LNERIVAVALYYYRVDTALREDKVGGNLEFFDKRPFESSFWLWEGDGELSWDQATEVIMSTPHCQVPIQTGSLVVFSNYQMIHRVLRMRNHTKKTLARSFVALFFVDQRAPLPSSAQPETILTCVRDSQRKKRRIQRLQRQLTPAPDSGVGVFGLHLGTPVVTTGNGSVGLLGWLADHVDDPEKIEEMLSYSVQSDKKGLIKIGALNVSPPVGRGVSWAAEMGSLPLPANQLSLRQLCWLVITSHQLDLTSVPDDLVLELDSWLLLHQHLHTFINCLQPSEDNE
jgi:hypothetical protein